MLTIRRVAVDGDGDLDGALQYIQRDRPGEPAYVKPDRLHPFGEDEFQLRRDRRIVDRVERVRFHVESVACDADVGAVDGQTVGEKHSQRCEGRHDEAVGVLVAVEEDPDLHARLNHSCINRTFRVGEAKLDGARRLTGASLVPDRPDPASRFTVLPLRDQVERVVDDGASVGDHDPVLRYEQIGQKVRLHHHRGAVGAGDTDGALLHRLSVDGERQLRRVRSDPERRVAENHVATGGFPAVVGSRVVRHPRGEERAGGAAPLASRGPLRLSRDRVETIEDVVVQREVGAEELDRRRAVGEDRAAPCEEGHRLAHRVVAESLEPVELRDGANRIP